MVERPSGYTSSKIQCQVQRWPVRVTPLVMTVTGLAEPDRPQGVTR